MASQQSWSDWLWSTYSSVVNTTTGATVTTSEQSTSQASKASSPSPSPYGPYVRTGRGGAGNFTWQSPQPPQHPADPNLEAQNPTELHDQRKAAASLEHHDTDSALKSRAAQTPAPQYVRVGRNLVLRSDLPAASEPDDSARQGVVSGLTASSSSRVAHPGRGGAGNYAVAAELNAGIESQRVRKEEGEAEKRRERIEEEMERAVPAPTGAWLGGKKKDDST